MKEILLLNLGLIIEYTAIFIHNCIMYFLELKSKFEMSHSLVTIFIIIN